jgi:TonB family protein
MRIGTRYLNALIGLGIVAVCPPPGICQSGAARGRSSPQVYAVNLHFAVFQFDAAHSPAIDEVTRLGQSFASSEDEAAYLRDTQKLGDVAVRHNRFIGLTGGETFNDAALLGPQYMLLAVTPSDVARGQMKLAVRARYGGAPLLDANVIDLESFETVLLKGGKGMFGIKRFIGAGGRQDSAPMERTLLVSVTPEIVPISNLKNRPADLSHLVDEYGAPIQLKEGDRFVPPSVIDRVVPKYETGRSIRGGVLLEGVVTPEGKISNVRVLRSLDPDFDLRAVDAFREYKFSAGLLNDKPASATYREELTFGGGDVYQPEKDKPKSSKRRFPRPWP